MGQCYFIAQRCLFYFTAPNKHINKWALQRIRGGRDVHRQCPGVEGTVHRKYHGGGRDSALMMPRGRKSRASIMSWVRKGKHMNDSPGEEELWIDDAPGEEESLLNK